jgi:hypothetical protein
MGHPRNSFKAVLGVARPQGVEGLGMAAPCETLTILWIPLSYGPRRNGDKKIGKKYHDPEKQNLSGKTSYYSGVLFEL